MAWGQKEKVYDFIQRLRSNSPGKSILILPTRAFGDEECRELCEALAENVTVEEFLASGHHLSAVGTRLFASALRKNKALKRLALGDKNLGDEAAIELLEKWENETLTHLDFELKGIGAPTCSALCTTLCLAPHALVEVRLGRNQLGDAGVIALCKGLSSSPSLCSIDLQWNNITVEGCKVLGRAFRGEGDETKKGFSLTLDGNPLGSLGLAAFTSQLGEETLKGKISLAFLGLQECNIGNDGIRSLCEAMKSDSVFSSIDCLGLANNNITDSTCLGSEIKRSGSLLRKLYIGRNTLGIKGVMPIGEALKEASFDSPLKVLDLTAVSRNPFTEGEIYLQQFLKNCADSKCLERLSLLGNAIGNAGALYFCQALQTNNSIKEVSLACVGLTSDGVQPVLDALIPNEVLETIELGGNDVGKTGKECIEKFRKQKTSLDIAFEMADHQMTSVNNNY